MRIRVELFCNGPIRIEQVDDQFSILFQHKFHKPFTQHCSGDGFLFEKAQYLIKTTGNVVSLLMIVWVLFKIMGRNQELLLWTWMITMTYYNNDFVKQSVSDNLSSFYEKSCSILAIAPIVLLKYNFSDFSILQFCTNTKN